ncbi:MAG: chaperonin GroEL [Planctomycetes bacterium]|nr:chaperonin GroEL [Planctomycetota bacterium]
MAKQMLFDSNAREAVKNGLLKAAKAIKSTLGPKGRSVVIDKSWGAPTITEDGVTVAEEIELKDPYENIGAQMLKHAASKTNDDTGDGTTTATVLAEAIYVAGLRFIAAGADPMAMSRGIQNAVEKVNGELKKMSQPVGKREQIQNVATISAKNDKVLGKMFADAMEKTGKDGTITIEESKSIQTELKVVKGMQFDRGYLSPYFITNPDEMKVELEAPYILLVEDKISSTSKLIPLMELIVPTKKSLMVIAEDIEGEALALLVVNKLKGSMQCHAVKAPGFGDRRKAMLEDVGILVGAKPVFKDLGIELDKIDLSYLGTAEKVISNADNTIIVGGKGNRKAIDERIKQLRAEIETTDSDYDREKLHERLAKLAGGVAQINIGAATETEMKERKSRAEDAFNAVKAAMEEGILPGGGVALIRAGNALKNLSVENADENYGVQIVLGILDAPAKIIIQNAGYDAGMVLKRVKEGSGSFGFNAENGEFVDLINAGIIDPAKVVRNALQNAASVAALLLTTECIIAEEPEENEAHGHKHHPGHRH